MVFLELNLDDADDFVESVTRAHTAIFRRYTRVEFPRSERHRRVRTLFIESFDSSSAESALSINREEFEKALNTKWTHLQRLKSLKRVDKNGYQPSFLHPGLPRYHPPSKDAAFCILLNGNKPPERPIFPRCLTNTALANYVHKLYIYESYLFNKIQQAGDVCSPLL